MWQVHVVQHPNVAFGVDAHTLLDEARRENDAVHHRGAHLAQPRHHVAWVSLAVLVDAHIGIEICLSCKSPVGSNRPLWEVLRGSNVIPAEEFLVREHQARQVQGLFATDREHAHALQHVRVGRTTTSSATCPVSCVDGAHSESAAASRSRPFRSRPDLTRSPLLQRVGFVRQTATQTLELRLDALQQPVWPHCTHFAWFSASSSHWCS